MSLYDINYSMHKHYVLMRLRVAVMNLQLLVQRSWSTAYIVGSVGSINASSMLGELLPTPQSLEL